MDGDDLKFAASRTNACIAHGRRGKHKVGQEEEAIPKQGDGELKRLVGRERIQRWLRTREAVDTPHRAWVGLRGEKPAGGADGGMFR